MLDEGAREYAANFGDGPRVWPSSRALDREAGGRALRAVEVPRLACAAVTSHDSQLPSRSGW
jgi:hypothetical protein